MPRKNHFERFEDHTRLKHFLLDVYLKQWAVILAAKFPRTWFVDAFAGAGRDTTGTPGSPVIAAGIAREINAEKYGIAAGATLPAAKGMRVIAIEADRKRYERLVDSMRPYTGETLPVVAHVREGTLPSLLDRMLGHVKTDPALYFLDPFGVDGLDAAVLPRLLQGPHAEILLLFSDEGAVRLAGKAGANVPTHEELLAERARDHGLFGLVPDLNAELAAADRLAVDRVLAGHASNGRADEILDRAFGGHAWRAAIDATDREDRQERFIDLYEDLLRHAGAAHVLRFAVSTEARRHKYTLLHASKQVRAFAAMKDAMHRAYLRRRPDAPEPAPTLFGLLGDAPGAASGGAPPAPGSVNGEGAPTSDTEPVVEAAVTREARQIERAVDTIAAHFAGQAAVRWTDKPPAGTVQQYALEYTPILKHQFPALQQALEHRGYLSRKTPATYAFPATGPGPLLGDRRRERHP